jgi:molecular chaperone DnaJ
VQQTILGNIQTVSNCPQCRGQGKISKEECPVCRGTGSNEEDDTFKIKIPQGIPDAVTLRFQDRGHAGRKGGNYGSLFINIEVTPHEKLERRGNDIYTDVTIDAVTAVLGGSIELPTVHGDEQLKIPAGTQPETVLKMQGRGGPKFRGNGNGDQYVKVLIKIPSRLSREQKQLWEELSRTKDKPGLFGNLF